MSKYATLEHFINNMNIRRELFKEEPLSIPKTEEEAKPIIDSLSSSLSPENLHQDGEITPQEAQNKFNYFKSVHEELEMVLQKEIELDY